MSKLIIIAGPQAAGKSTIVTQLTSQLHNVAALLPEKKRLLLFPLQESRQIIVHTHMLLGGVFMTPEHEREVVCCDLNRMNLILERNHQNFLYLDECNVFTLAHAAAHGITNVEQYWDEYMDRLTALNAAVIFLDVPPDTSWDRRRSKYEQRLVYFPADNHKEIMRQYQAYLEKLHPFLLAVYERFPLRKALIDASSSQENVMRVVCETMALFTSTS